MNKIRYSCAEHIEEILEIFLDETEELPVMESINEQSTSKENEIICDQCELKALYQLLGSEVKATWE